MRLFSFDLELIVSFSARQKVSRSNLFQIELQTVWLAFHIAVNTLSWKATCIACVYIFQDVERARACITLAAFVTV